MNVAFVVKAISSKAGTTMGYRCPLHLISNHRKGR